MKGIRVAVTLVLLWCTGGVLFNIFTRIERNSSSEFNCNPDLGLFFVHIQKTGGTTLRSILVDKFIRKNISFPEEVVCKAGWNIKQCNHSDLTPYCPGPKQLFSNHLAPSTLHCYSAY
jgi:hypothetical protein